MGTTKSKRFNPAICLIHVAILFTVNDVFAAPADESAWTLVSEKGAQNQAIATNSVSNNRWIKPSNYQRAILDLTRFGQQINATGLAEAGVIVSIPNPDGNLERFRVTPAGDMHQDLQLWFARRGMPMQTYRGVSLDMPGNTIRMDFGGPGGLHASVYSVGKSYFVDPLFKTTRKITPAIIVMIPGQLMSLGAVSCTKNRVTRHCPQNFDQLMVPGTVSTVRVAICVVFDWPLPPPVSTPVFMVGLL